MVDFPTEYPARPGHSRLVRRWCPLLHLNICNDSIAVGIRKNRFWKQLMSGITLWYSDDVESTLSTLSPGYEGNIGYYPDAPSLWGDESSLARSFSQVMLKPTSPGQLKENIVDVDVNINQYWIDTVVEGLPVLKRPMPSLQNRLVGPNFNNACWSCD